MAITDILTQIDGPGGSSRTPPAAAEASPNGQSDYRKQLSRSLNDRSRSRVDGRDNNAETLREKSPSATTKDRTDKTSRETETAAERSQSTRTSRQTAASRQTAEANQSDGAADAAIPTTTQESAADAQPAGDDPHEQPVVLAVALEHWHTSAPEVDLPEPPAGIAILLHATSETGTTDDVGTVWEIPRDLIPPPPGSFLQVVDTDVSEVDLATPPAVLDALNAAATAEAQLLAAVVDAQADSTAPTQNENVLLDESGGNELPPVGQGGVLQETITQSIQVIGAPPEAADQGNQPAPTLISDAAAAASLQLPDEQIARQSGVKASGAAEKADGTPPAGGLSASSAGATRQPTQIVVSQHGVVLETGQPTSAEISDSQIEFFQDSPADQSAAASKGNAHAAGAAAGRTGPESPVPASPQSASANAATSTGEQQPADPAQTVDRVSQAIRFAAGQSRPLRVRLHPPELGTVQIEIVSRNGGIFARLDAHTPAGHRAILDSLSQLHEALAHHGTAVDRIEVHLTQDTRNHSHGDFSDANYSERQEDGAEQNESDQRESRQHDSADDEQQRQAPLGSPFAGVDQLDIQI